MSEVINLPTTKREIEEKKVANISPGDLEFYEFLASLSKKYKAKAFKNKSYDALILQAKKLNTHIKANI